MPSQVGLVLVPNLTACNGHDKITANIDCKLTATKTEISILFGCHFKLLILWTTAFTKKTNQNEINEECFTL